MDDDVKVATIGALMRRADRLEDEAKELKRLVDAAEKASAHIPEKARGRVPVAYRRVDGPAGLSFQLVTADLPEAE